MCSRLHPATGSAAIWEHQYPALTAAGYRVIAYSRRGHYRSESGPAEDPGNSVDDLRAIADALGVSRFHLVGSAAGGFMVPDFALTHPERLLSGTIACSQAGIAERHLRTAIERLQPPAFSSRPGRRAASVADRPGCAGGSPAPEAGQAAGGRRGQSAVGNVARPDRPRDLDLLHSKYLMLFPVI